MNKWLVALALLGMSVASAKTYDITLSDPSAVGKYNLKPGQYELTVKASTAVFKDLKTGKSYQTTAKVEQAEKKFDDTEVETKRVGGENHITEIRLHGTKTKLEFN